MQGGSSSSKSNMSARMASLMLLGGASSVAFSSLGDVRSSGREVRAARHACQRSRSAVRLRAAGLSTTSRAVCQPGDGKSRQQRSLVPFLTSVGASLLFGHIARSPRSRTVLQATSSVAAATKESSQRGRRLNLRKNPTARCRTNLGEFTMELFVDKAPITASNFIALAMGNFYTGIYFHRVVPGVLCQFGCPYAREPFSPVAGYGLPHRNTRFEMLDGSGRRCRRIGGNIPDEFDERLSNTQGTVAMVNSGPDNPDSGGSQFFFNVCDNTHLDWWDERSRSANPVFGKVVDGFSVVQHISWVSRNEKHMPLEPVQMMSIEVDLDPTSDDEEDE